MDFSRRSFMNMLGLGGLIAAAEIPEAAARAVPIFGSDEETALVVPDADMVSGHLVVYAKTGLIERVPPEDVKAYQSKYGGTPVARLIRTREPGGAGIREIPPRDGVISCRPRLTVELDDAHTVFYAASMEMRTKFADFSRQTLERVPREVRPMATLVTVVDAAIHAQPVGLREFVDDHGYYQYQQDHLNPGGERGFDMVCRFKQFVRVGGARKGTETFTSYSEHGEFPINPPRNIDMALLMKLDREIVSANAVREPDVRSILRRFGSWVGKTA